MSGKPLLMFGSSESIHKCASTSSLSGRRSGSFQLPPPVQMRDWRNALRSQPTYKIGNRTFTFRLPNHVVLTMALLLVLLIFFYIFHPSGHARQTQGSIGWSIHKYNDTYPLTAPVLHGGRATFKIAIVADLDQSSKRTNRENTWVSYQKTGLLTYNRVTDEVNVSWDPAEEELVGHYALNGRGMELSELKVFNGKLYTADDRTGIVYQFQGNQLVPWVILMDGDGSKLKGFKSEWMTVKDQTMYVGSMGKEWTDGSGVFQSHNPMWVKAISVSGEVTHLNWIENFKAIRRSIGIHFPGYMVHESGEWSEIRKNWYFLPRRCSKEQYNETLDEMMGCNVLIECDEHFHKIKAIRIGDLQNPKRAFSSFKFVPGSEDRIILGLKSEEYLGKTASFYTVFTVEGKILVPETKIDTTYKYEGIEFV